MMHIIIIIIIMLYERDAGRDEVDCASLIFNISISFPIPAQSEFPRHRLYNTIRARVQ